MKILFFTPVIVSSAIGRMAALVVNQLLKMNQEVIVVRTEEQQYFNQAHHDFNTEIISWNAEASIEHLAKTSDIIIYQIGDNFEFHRGCLEWLPKLSGIVCLHDYFIGNLFHVWAWNHSAEAKMIASQWYDEKLCKNYFNYNGADELVQNTAHTMPMTEWIASMAIGIITHSAWGIDRVSRSCSGPIYITPLAYNAIEHSDSLAPSLSKSKDECMLLTVGNINQNKRVDKIIAAIGKNERLSAKIQYTLAGSITPHMKQHLLQLANQYKVQLNILGQVDDLRLMQEFKRADIIACLRMPVLESASASLIESLLYGKPVLVSNVAHFKELPANLVYKISTENEIADLQQTLEFLLQNPDERLQVGEKAKQWAQVTYDAARYAETLLDLIMDVSAAKPIIEANQTLAQTLKQWGGSENILSEPTLDPLQLFNLN